LFNYVFYKSSIFYEKWGEENGYIAGGVVTSMSIVSILLSVLIFVLHFCFNETINSAFVWIAVIICGALSFFFKEEKYKELKEKYVGEDNSKLKGWLVFLYVIGTVGLYFMSLYICGH